MAIGVSRSDEHSGFSSTGKPGVAGSSPSDALTATKSRHWAVEQSSSMPASGTHDVCVDEPNAATPNQTRIGTKVQAPHGLMRRLAKSTDMPSARRKGEGVEEVNNVGSLGGLVVLWKRRWARGDRSAILPLSDECTANLLNWSV